MPSAAMKYNPAFLSSDELVSGFVVRTVELDLLVETIRENSTASNQHVLLVGARGLGKTMLLRRVVAEVQSDPLLSQAWYPILFGEESYQVFSAGELWLEALLHVGEQTGEAKWKATYDELIAEPDSQRLADRALARLMEFADAREARLILVVENLQLIFDGQADDDQAWILRHTLQNEPRIMLLASATCSFDAITGYDKALYDLFRVTDLDPLSAEQTRVLWQHLTGEDLDGTQIRPLHILTGGNPRLLVIVARFAADTSFQTLMQDLAHLIDDHTEYFKANLEALAPVERRVFAALADIWDPATSKQVAERTRMTASAVSSLLTRLVSRGAVAVVSAGGHKKRYQVAERLYNIYHLMRRRGRQTARVNAVVDFMVQFYGPDELIHRAAEIAQEAIALLPEQRHDHYQAYDRILDRAPAVRDRILRATCDEFFAQPEAQENLRAVAAPEPRPSEEELRSRVAASPEHAKDWLALAALLANDERLAEAETACRRAIALDDTNSAAWRGLATLLERQEQLEEAEAAYVRAIELDPNGRWLWTQLGDVRHRLGCLEEAEAAFRRAIEIAGDCYSMVRLGQVLSDSERYEEAEAAFSKAIACDGEHSWAWGELGAALEETGRTNEAEAAYRRSLDLDEDFAWAWSRLGSLLERQGRLDDAEAAFRKATECEPQVPFGWLAILHCQLSQNAETEEAVATVRKALAATERSELPLHGLAWRLYESNRGDLLETGEALAREATEQDPQSGQAWHTLAAILGRMGRWDEALSVVPRFLEPGKEPGVEASVIDFFIDAAAAGRAAPVLKLLVDSGAALEFEPLAAALRMFLGEELTIATEIAAVARDVELRIEQRRAELAGGGDSDLVANQSPKKTN